MKTFGVDCMTRSLSMWKKYNYYSDVIKAMETLKIEKLPSWQIMKHIEE
jgi:hypothetical protein